MNKRLLGGLAAAGIIGGGVYGFAATLTPTSDNFGAGGSLVASCDSAVSTSYTSQYIDGDYKVTHVVVEGISALCSDHTVGVTLSGPSNGTGNIGDGSAVLGAGLTGEINSISIPVTPNPLGGSVSGVDVVIHNGNSSSGETNS